jgi:homeodomain interacting protein kinase
VRFKISVKYEQHAGQSQKKRLLAMAQNECLLSATNQSATNNNNGNNQTIPKQEPTEFNYEYPQMPDKRASWAPPAHHNHHKREPVTYLTTQPPQPAPAPPPLAHAKNPPTSWSTQIYRQHTSSNTPLGSSPAGLLSQDIYAQAELYRQRPTVFVSQAPYQTYNRVVPPPAHNGSGRQVCSVHIYIHYLIVLVAARPS